MPSDANGVHTLPDGYLAVTGETILASQHNPPLEDLSASMTLRLMRTGVAPMTGPLKAADSTASAPGYAFASAPTNGFYPTVDGIGVAVGGAKVAEFTAAGLKSGSRFIGELIDFSGTTAPALTVFPVGQTLSRTTYADLWTFAQVEIAAGNTFYNNGNGSTTFGIGDCRGRVSVPADNMGGSAANRITTAGSGINGLILGSTGGVENHTLTLAQVPTGINSSGSNVINVTSAANLLANPTAGATTGGAQATAVGGGIGVQGSSGTNTINVTSNNTSGNAHPNAQPSIIVKKLLFAGA